MNIFVINENPDLIAKDHCDKHLIKMIVETAQLLSSKFHEQNLEAQYRKTHFNHPCSIWCRYSQENYLWLLDLGLSLCMEYTNRYRKIHKSQSVIEFCFDNLFLLKFDYVGFTTPPACMPEQYKQPNIHKYHQLMLSYRLYYKAEKSKFAAWNYSPKPLWYEQV